MLKIECAPTPYLAVRLLRSAPLFVGHLCAKKSQCSHLQAVSIKALPTSPFGVGRSRNESIRLSEEFYESQPPNLKQVSRRNFCGLRCTAGHPIAQFRDLYNSLIVFLSTHGRGLLAQTAKTKNPENRGKKKQL